MLSSLFSPTFHSDGRYKVDPMCDLCAQAKDRVLANIDKELAELWPHHGLAGRPKGDDIVMIMTILLMRWVKVHGDASVVQLPGYTQLFVDGILKRYKEDEDAREGNYPPRFLTHRPTRSH